MEEISKSIKEVLPNLSTDKLDAVLKALVESGVEDTVDLKYVMEEDLHAHLKAIQTRKLLSVWKAADATVMTSVTEPSTSAPTLVDHAPNLVTTPPRLQPSQRLHSPQNATWPDTMDLPWSKMPKGLSSAIKDKKRPTPKLRKQMVRILVDAMLEHHANPNQAQSMIVAKRVVRLNPESFEDRSTDGERMGTGYYSLGRQLRYRVEHMNRDSLMVRLRRPRRVNNGATSAPTPNKATDAYGCIAWQPDLLENETEDVMEEKRRELVEIYERAGPKKGCYNAIEGGMVHTYYLQRKDINVVPPPSIEEIENRWPFLFWQRWLFMHFKMLTGVPIHTKMLESLDKQGTQIKKYMESLDCSTRKGKLVQGVLKQIPAAAQQMQTPDEVEVPALILMIMAYFQEKEESMFLLADETDSHTDVEKNLNLPNTPRIIVKGQSILTGSSWLLAIDGKVVSSFPRGRSTFISALCGLFSAYYAFNLEYDDQCEITLEFIQRCFLSIQPERGTKCSKKGKKSGKDRKKDAINPHVSTFLRNMADFAWM